MKKYSIEFDDIIELEEKVATIKLIFEQRAKEKAAKLDKIGVSYELVDSVGIFLIRGDNLTKEQENKVRQIFRPMKTKLFNKKFGITENN